MHDKYNNNNIVTETSLNIINILQSTFFVEKYISFVINHFIQQKGSILKTN